jgi:hypothetical protein
MKSHKFLAGTLTGVALVLLVSVLLLTQLGRQLASAASGTPETKSTASAAASPSTKNDQMKTSVANDPESRMVTPVSDAEWGAGATTLGMSASDFEAAIKAGKLVADLGAPHNVTAMQVWTAMVAAGTAAVNTAVQNGTITQADADALTSGIVTAIADKVTHANTDTGSAAGTPTANDQALEAQKRALASQSDDVSNAVTDAEISAMASTLGVSADDLKTALSNPADIATLAAAHNVTAQQLQDAMVTAGQQALNQAVTAGTISPADADSLKTGLVQLMAEKLSHMASAPDTATPAP